MGDITEAITTYRARHRRQQRHTAAVVRVQGGALIT